VFFGLEILWVGIVASFLQLIILPTEALVSFQLSILKKKRKKTLVIVLLIFSAIT
jgi:hypothetical protein